MISYVIGKSVERSRNQTSYMRKRRIDKKLHKFWLEYEVVDLSQNSYWREKLFNSETYQEFHINKSNMPNIPQELSIAINRYDLKFKVAKVPSSETDSWLSENESIIFRFWAEAYPSVKIYSGNNPSVK